MSDHPGGLTRDHVVWAYRLLLDRDPESEDAIGPKLAGSRDTRDLRQTSDDLGRVPGEESRLRAQQRPDGRDQGARTAACACSSTSPTTSSASASFAAATSRTKSDWRGVLRPGDTAIDVGAHIGFFTMQMAAAVGAAGRVYAFEPFDANADLLEKSITREPLRRSGGLSAGPRSARWPGRRL